MLHHHGSICCLKSQTNGLIHEPFLILGHSLIFTVTGEISGGVANPGITILDKRAVPRVLGCFMEHDLKVM
jgi:hypothetical protein